MKKSYYLKNLDCANCAGKIESKLKKIDGVTNVQIAFMTQKMTLEAPEDSFSDVLEQAKTVIKKVDSKIVLTV